MLKIWLVDSRWIFQPKYNKISVWIRRKSQIEDTQSFGVIFFLVISTDLPRKRYHKIHEIANINHAKVVHVCYTYDKTKKNLNTCISLLGESTVKVTGMT